MVSSPPLTARGVKAMLTRAGIGYSALAITDDPAVWTNVETGARSTSVKIEGPDAARREVFWALFEKGFSTAPYSGYDMWSRR
jgi:hypothetical protein